MNCHGCGAPISEETGMCREYPAGHRFDDNVSYLYCLTCRPPGRGYTLADLQQMRDQNEAARAAYQMSQMDLVGPDVYFAVKHDTPPEDPH